MHWMCSNRRGKGGKKRKVFSEICKNSQTFVVVLLFSHGKAFLPLKVSCAIRCTFANFLLWTMVVLAFFVGLGCDDDDGHLEISGEKKKKNRI